MTPLTEKALVHSSVRILAIDPGKSGAACLLGRGTLAVRRDYRTLNDIVSGIRDLVEIETPDLAVIEQVNARPGEGVCSVWAFGKATGVAEGAIASLLPSHELHEVHPLKWQNFFRRQFGLPRPKEFDSRAICQKLLPGYLTLFKRKLDHNTADAVLIAVWALLVLAPSLKPAFPQVGQRFMEWSRAWPAIKF